MGTNQDPRLHFYDLQLLKTSEKDTLKALEYLLLIKLLVLGQKYENQGLAKI